MLYVFILIAQEHGLDFLRHESIYGPFSTERAARQWADEELSDEYSYRITTMRLPL
jgi:hypothetical protein